MSAVFFFSPAGGEVLPRASFYGRTERKQGKKEDEKKKRQKLEQKRKKAKGRREQKRVEEEEKEASFLSFFLSLVGRSTDRFIHLSIDLLLRLWQRADAFCSET